ncbi:fatty acid-binding protein-like [Panonychus citri]|uniref:fatty acid-binding protein-like n=1 Tax=Panonychus citri TaxID=50023 RepID=UPI0023078E61|nr:fatty acid-binding protein-like [Panonychus citri]XP_053203585.1 fatty acid-binding protein-like [Panonychus citri]WRK22553.1 fatty acid binding protein [Panonychus citri]
MAEFAGEYSFVSSENFDEFLKALGLNFLLRKTVGALKPTFIIKVDDDGTITFKSISTFKTSETKFKLNEEFEEKRMDGVTCKSTVTQEGNKLIQKQQSEPPAEITREFNGDEMKITCTCGEVTATRIYKKSSK